MVETGRRNFILGSSSLFLGSLAGCSALNEGIDLAISNDDQSSQQHAIAVGITHDPESIEPIVRSAVLQNGETQRWDRVVSYSDHQYTAEIAVMVNNELATRTSLTVRLAIDEISVEITPGGDVEIDS